MRHLKTISAAMISLSLFAGGVQAATPGCTSADELAALRTAAVQQQLMVAGLTCQATESYNRFVLAYRPELQKSDAELKAYFIRRAGEHGEAEYDTFKTKLANLSSLSEVGNSGAYCANARAAFDMAMRGPQTLGSFVADQRLMIALPDQKLCIAEPSPVLVTARVEPAPVVKLASRPAPLKLAAAAPVVAGVPAHQLPASPFGAAPPVTVAAAAAPIAAPPPPAPVAYVPQQANDSDALQDRGDYYEDAPPPPPRPQRPRYGAAGWPPGWGPQPYARWYPRDDYYYYYGR